MNARWAGVSDISSPRAEAIRCQASAGYAFEDQDRGGESGGPANAHPAMDRDAGPFRQPELQLGGQAQDRGAVGDVQVGRGQLPEADPRIGGLGSLIS